MSYGKTECIARQVAVICMVVMLLVSGCADRYGRVLKPETDRVVISDAHSEFSILANDSDLPVRYVSEGKIGVSKVEAALEKADSVELQARAELKKKLADINARRSETRAQVNKDISEAEALRQKYHKEFAKATADIEARDSELQALIGRKETIISSLVKEGESKNSDIISEARSAYDLETARITQLKEINKIIEVESNATMLEMTQAAKATRERADATVTELEAQAGAVQLVTEARVDELKELIKSTGIQTNSEVNRMNVSREAIIQNSGAQVQEIRSRADTVEANLANEEYQLKLTKAETVKSETDAKTQEKSAGAPTRFDKALAEIERLRAKTSHHQATAQASFDSMLAEIEAKLEDELNEVKKIRITSDRTEQVARAEFVKSEATARAEAIRRTAVHAEALAEAQKRHIIAEAEAEAAKIKEQVLAEIAAKKAAGKVDIKKNTTEINQQPKELHEVPAVPQVKPVAVRIEPDHIANFRISFANVMRDRSKANAHELVANATFEEAKTNILSIKAQEDAIAGEQFAIADALEAQSRARFNELEIKMAKEMDVTESKYRQHVAQAESFRMETEAEVIDFRSQANAFEQIAEARADQLLAESQALSISGQNDIEELKIKLWAAQERGDAGYLKLMTEAKSVRDSKEALALQIDAQIDSARRYLSAELAKIGNAISSGERIAQADYQEAITQATVVQQKTEAEIARIHAQFAMEHAITKARIIRDRELARSQTLRGEAACDRLVADARATSLSEKAGFDAKRAGAEADMNIILAQNAAKRESAKVKLNAVKARFAARIQQVKAERVIVAAVEHNEMAKRRTDLASVLDQAMAAREESNRKLAELQKKQAALQTASLVNWSDKLADFRK
ncbi:MAG: hypothetical protein FVQ82_00045 [Planctomycetes bacterium]|nr:hypothetical protein [Planctomycetota bacterium]